MRKSRFSEEEILAILDEARCGTPRDVLCGAHGISVQTFYRWRRRYGDAGEVPERRVRETELENARLRKLLIEKELENHRLQGVIRRKRSH